MMPQEETGMEGLSEPLLRTTTTNGEKSGHQGEAAVSLGESKGQSPPSSSSPLSSSPLLRPVAGGELGRSATISFRDVRYEVPDRQHRKERRVILDDIAGIVSPGQVLAVMGPSGCGKTTLLEILGGRIAPTRGVVMANGTLYGDDTKKMVGFVPQEEALFATLTVRETLLFSAQLTLPSSMPHTEKEQQVDQVLKELNISHVANNLIGDSVQRGVSGGERKRVSIGKELCCFPMSLLLDEPTSGLDSFTSIKVMKLLRMLAEGHRTIICSIHQPSTDIFALFDEVMLLASGRIVYCGPARTALAHFASLGCECPRYANPADFFLNLCNETGDHFNGNGDGNGNEGGYPHQGLTPREAVDQLIKAYRASTIKAETDRAISAASLAVEGPDGITLLRQEPSWAHRFWTLLARSSRNSRRNPLSSYVIFGRTIVMSLLVGSLYWQVQSKGGADEQMQNRLGALFFIVTNQVFSSLGTLHLLLDEKEVIAQESKSAKYPVSAYFWAKQVAELPFQLFVSVLFSTISYWMVGFGAGRGVGNYIIYLLALMLTDVVAESYILVCGSITTDNKVATVIAPIFLCFFMLFSGFLVNSGSIPVYYVWIKWISFFFYINNALVKNELHGLALPNGRTGDDQITILNLPELSVASNLVIIGAMIVLFRLLALAFVSKNYTPQRFVLPPNKPDAQDPEAWRVEIPIPAPPQTHQSLQ